VKFALIPCGEPLLRKDKTKQENIYNPTKRTINWGKYIHFGKLFYTKVSHR